MKFGNDIYALSIAILHKKNAMHLKYYDKSVLSGAMKAKIKTVGRLGSMKKKR